MFINQDYQFQHSKGFIAIDGVNGAGKGTLIERLNQYLQGKEIKIRNTREPGGTPLGVNLRKILLNQNFQGSLTELFLFAADRNEHIHSVILPALKANQFVITDRFYYSTSAFQGYGRGLPLNQVEAINHLAVESCLPDLFILLDLAPEIGLSRTKKRNSCEHDKMEDEEIEFHKRIYQGFKEVGRTCKEPCLLVDASPSPDIVWQTVKPTIDKLLNSWQTMR